MVTEREDKLQLLEWVEELISVNERLRDLMSRITKYNSPRHTELVRKVFTASLHVSNAIEQGRKEVGNFNLNEDLGGKNE
jgi:hypothetical protein